MSETNPLHVNGIVPTVPTPSTIEEQIDFPALRRLVDFGCATGACAMCLPAYASEFYKLSESERLQLVAEAVRQAAGRLPVLAQADFVSLPQAIETAREVERIGASAIAAAVPRMFAFGEPDFWRYFDRPLSSIDIPLMIQDVNPSGTTVTARCVSDLHSAHPHFRWIKLEEPMMSSKVVGILEATSGEVGVLEGWGGMYMLDLTGRHLWSHAGPRHFRCAGRGVSVGHPQRSRRLSGSCRGVTANLVQPAAYRAVPSHGKATACGSRHSAQRCCPPADSSVGSAHRGPNRVSQRSNFRTPRPTHLPRHPSLLPSHEGVLEA